MCYWIFHHYQLITGQYSCIAFMHYWNFEYTKNILYTMVKVEGAVGPQGLATEVTHLRLN